MIGFLVFLVLLAKVYSDCEISYNRFSKALFLQHIQDDYFISTSSDAVQIPRNGVVDIFCESGFGDNRQDLQYGHLLTLTCKDRSIYFNESEGHYSGNYFYQYDIACNEIEMPFYSTKLDYCDFSGLQYGIEIKGEPIVLAEYCYNFNTSEFVSIHYVTGKRSRLLHQQTTHNPSYVAPNELSLKGKLSINVKRYPELILSNQWKVFSPHVKSISKHVEFQFHELVPNRVYASFLKDFTGDVDYISVIPWWVPLRIGNWDILQNILNRTSTRTTFEIYAGRSGVATYPNDFLFNSEHEITFELYNEEKHIPLYIWHYIKPRDYHQFGKEFVLVAVNSPFFEEGMVICEDICEDIEWLHLLKSTRRNPVFGYMFCCNPAEVWNKLDGFPHLNVNQTDL